MKPSERKHITKPQTLVVLILAFCIGCSGASSPSQPSLPDSDFLTTSAGSGLLGQNYRQLWGYWEISISGDHQNAEAVPFRTGSMHLNALGFLEKFPCSDCLKVSNLVSYPDKRLSADFTLTHPFPGNSKLTGFDVRGIFITEANYQFPSSERWIGWGDDIPRLLLPNGYTTLFNPWEYDFSQPGPECLKYIPGKYSTGGVLESTLNGYVSFRREAPRRMFESGGSETRTVWLQLPEGPLKFGYAVDCSWKKVDGPVTDPLTDFPPDANCLEAYRVDVQFGSNLEPIAGTTQPIEVQVFDHQGLDSIDSVILEAPDIFSWEDELEYKEDVGINNHLFIGSVTNEFGAGPGDYPMLVRVIDTEEDPNLGQIDAWFLYTVEIGARNGWVRTWGSDTIVIYANDYANSATVDENGNIYVTGEFRKTVDLDPGDGVEEHTAVKGAAFLTKFDPDGEFIWTRVWDGMGTDHGIDVTIDNAGNILFAGSMYNLIDLDPGPGNDAHEGSYFLCKLDSDGNYLYGKSWDLGIVGITIDGSDNIYLAGCFSGKTDFDPGDGEDFHWPNGVIDSHLIKLDTHGNYIWCRTWGGPGGSFSDADRMSDVVADKDGFVYVSGVAGDSTDFDPGIEVEMHDAGKFISKFAPTGKFLAVNVWDARDNYLAVDNVGNLYITGEISKYDTIDLDTGPGVDERSGPCEFLAMYNSTGDYLWCRTWGQALARPVDIAVASTGEIYVIGTFHWNLVDFDPSGNTDYHGSQGEDDIYLSKYLVNGEYQWTRTWGGVNDEKAFCVAADDSGNAFGVGEFQYLVDFDPGPGEENKTGYGGGDAYLIKIPPDGNW